MAKLTERYANSLLELSEEANNFDADFEHATLMRDILAKDDMQALLTHPRISNSEKKELLEKAFSETVSDHMMGLLYLMIDKNRESIIVPVLTDYIDGVNERLGRVEARVVSAQPLNDTQVESIRQLLTERVNKTVELKIENDPDVIGGFYILVDDHIFDGTVRSKLNDMKESLKRGGYQ